MTSRSTRPPQKMTKMITTKRKPTLPTILPAPRLKRKAKKAARKKKVNNQIHCSYIDSYFFTVFRESKKRISANRTTPKRLPRRRALSLSLGMTLLVTFLVIDSKI